RLLHQPHELRRELASPAAAPRDRGAQGRGLADQFERARRVYEALLLASSGERAVPRQGASPRTASLWLGFRERKSEGCATCPSRSKPGNADSFGRGLGGDDSRVAQVGRAV